MLLLAWGLAGGSRVALAQEGAPERVALVTMAPGQEFWNAFGHNALLLEYPGGASVSYNFGYFDFDEPGFLSRFALGAMDYLAVALPGREDLDRYVADGRAVWLQELDLDPSQRARLASLLAAHVQPDQRRYRYDYFRNNCSTKLRDMIDDVTGDAFTLATERRSHGYTWRGLALAQSAQVWWMYLGMHAGLGLIADETLSIRDESYIPALLMDAMRSVRMRSADGLSRPLVLREYAWPGSPTMPSAQTQAPDTWLWFLAAGALWCAALLSARGALRGIAVLSSAFILGAGGAACVFFWFCTAHWAAALNQNLLLFNPLYLLLVPCWLWSGLRRWALPLSFILLVLGGLGSFAKVFPGFAQQNIEWVLVLLPVQWAIWRVAFRAAQPNAIAASSSRAL